MIKIVEGSLFNNLPDYSTIIHQCNALGHMGASVARQIHIRYPEAFKKYHEYCSWFKNGHEHEIVGDIVGYRVNPKLLICNCIAQKGISRQKQMTDYEAWKNICYKLEKQTRYAIEETKQPWSIHAPYNIGCGLGGGDWESMEEIFYAYFGESPVELVFHRY